MQALFKYPPRFFQAMLGVFLQSSLFALPIVGMGLSSQKANAQSTTTGCPAGTRESGTNLIPFPFLDGAGNQTFSTELQTRNSNNAYGEGFTIVTDNSAFAANFPPGSFLAGILDPKAPPVAGPYYYSNPGNSDYVATNGRPRLWRQTISNLQPNTTYNFRFLLDNVLIPGTNDPQSGTTPDDKGYPPVIAIDVNGVNQPLLNGGVVRTVPDAWVPIQTTFTTGANQTTAEISIFDNAGTFFGSNGGNFRAVFGDDFGLAAIGTFQCLPNIGVAKSAGTPVDNGNGTFTVPYTVRVRNYGTDELSNLQLTEDLRTTFANAASFSIVPNSVTATTGATANNSFNGSSNLNLLSGSDRLAAGGEATVTFSVIITPGTGANGSGPFNNSVTATATAPGGIPVQDISNNDASTNPPNPDPNGDGNPSGTGEDQPTPVTLPAVVNTPRLGVAKSVGTITPNSDGSFNVPYTVTVRNVGNVALNNLQLTENLGQTFNGVTSFNYVSNSLRGTGATVNPSFSGTGTGNNTNLLSGTDTLPVGETATVQFNVRVVPGTNNGPYNNSVLGTAIASGNTQVQDTSNNGANVDSNGNGITDEPVDNQPTPVTFQQQANTPASIVIAKRITQARVGGASLTYSDIETDSSATPFPVNNKPIGKNTVPATTNFRSGDEVEYTIYYLSNGGQTATSINFCDLIPAGTTYIPNSIQVQSGNNPPASGGTYLNPLSPSAPGICSNTSIPNGAVTVNLGDIGVNNFGLVKFRVRLN
jgi:uncharacterized repeat protein (TIGR01451 family)